MVSVLIITWKRAALLQKCLDSLVPWAGQTHLQVVVMLNGEDAGSVQVLERMSAQHGWLRWKEIPSSSPGRARNLGLAELTGEWVFFLDDDAQVPPNYWQHWQATLAQLPRADVIGGIDSAPPESQGLARAVSISMSSYLCLGPTSERHKKISSTPYLADETKLTSCNLWVLRRHFEAGAQFPESYQRAEETVFLQDLEMAGAELWHAPELVVWHARRQTWQALLRTSFNSGFFRSLLMKERGHTPKWFWLPSVFVLLHLFVFIKLSVLIKLACWWGLPVMALSWGLCQRAQQRALWPMVVALHWMIPFSYGSGFLWQRLGGGPWQK